MLIKAVQAVREDRLDWKPTGGSHTVHQIPEYERMNEAYSQMSASEFLEQLSKNAEALSPLFLYFTAINNSVNND